MKKYTSCLLTLALFLFSSCLESGLEELPSFEDANISAVRYADCRYYTDEVSNVDGQKVVKFKELTIVKSTVEGNTVSVELTVPPAEGAFSEAIRSQVSQSSISIAVTISTAARIAPISGSPTLGSPGDWTTPHKYIVTAANGTTKEWTIQVTKFNK